MANKTVALIAVLAVVAVAGVGIYLFTADNSDTNPVAGTTFTDAAGREVKVPENIDNGIVTIGWYGSLRFVSYFDGMLQSIAGLENDDTLTSTSTKGARTYHHAYDYSSKADKIKYTVRGGISQEDIEKIGNKGPSAIVVIKGIYDANKDSLNQLGNRFCLVVINNSETSKMFDENYKLLSWYTDNIRMLGKVFNKVDRGERHINEVNALLSDLRRYVTTSNDVCYIAGVTYSGSNNYNCTYPNYLPMKMVSGTNAYTGTETKDMVALDTEVVGSMRFNKMLIDPQSSDKITTTESQVVLKNVYLRNTDSDTTNDVRLYSVLPMVYCSTNYDLAICGGYYLAHLLYGTLTKEQLDKKIENVFKVYWGSASANMLSKVSVESDAKSAANGMELPFMTEVKIVLDGGVYKIKKA